MEDLLLYLTGVVLGLFAGYTLGDYFGYKLGYRRGRVLGRLEGTIDISEKMLEILQATNSKPAPKTKPKAKK